MGITEEKKKQQQPNHIYKRLTFSLKTVDVGID